VEDNRIVELYLERSETAIAETQKKYGKYCHYIAYNILNSNSDAEECVNDTYLKVWDSIPPQKPKLLKSFIGRIARNLALDRYDREHALKRRANTDLALEEIGECVPEDDGRELSDEIALRDAINGFLESLPEETRIIFMRRYWYLSPVGHIAGDLGLSVSNVKVILMRTRKKLKAYLEKEGINL
jgi:RNA polymerase sigma-70 factor (ECF subfamily)